MLADNALTTMNILNATAETDTTVEEKPISPYAVLTDTQKYLLSFIDAGRTADARKLFMKALVAKLKPDDDPRWLQTNVGVQQLVSLAHTVFGADIEGGAEAIVKECIQGYYASVRAERRAFAG